MPQRPRWIAWSIAVASATCLAGSAGAETLSLWDFDGNNQPGATSAWEGNHFSDAGSFGIGPFQGSNQGVLETAGGSAPATIESNLELGGWRTRVVYWTAVYNQGYSNSWLFQVNRGSAFQVTFDALAGDVLRFDWDMLTNENRRSPVDPATYTDFGYYHLSGAETTWGALANVNDGSFSALGATDYDYHTGQQTTELTLGTTGTYTITVGVHDIADANNDFASALVFDFFRLWRLPEPGTFGTVAGGLAALSWISRRRRP